MQKIDEKLLIKRFVGAKKTYEKHATIQKKMQDILIANALKFVPKHHDIIFEFGSGNGSFSRKIMRNFSYDKFICNDIINAKHSDFFTQNNDVSFMNFDMNFFEKHVNFRPNLIASNAALHWLNTEYFLQNIFRICEENSYLIFSTFGEDNFHEIAETTGISLRYFSMDFHKKMLKNFNILHMFSQKFIMNFPSPKEVFMHIKNTGTNAIKSEFFLSKRMLKQMNDNHNNSLTYDAIFVIAKRMKT